MMKRYSYLWILVLMIVNNATWAYGGGSSSSKACDKPKFSDFVPAENTTVTPGTEFSFTASKNTYPTTIKVDVKGQSVAVKAEKKNDGTYAVKGMIPATVKADFIRIAISADAQNNCKGAGGWLVKIAK